MEDRFAANAPTDPVELTERVQELLQRKGFYDGPIDGIDGPETLSALKTYQESNGLPSTNGVNAQAYGQLSVWEINRRQKPSEQVAEASINGESNSTSSSTASSVEEQEAARRAELSNNHEVVNFQTACPDLFIPDIYEKRHQNIIPVYAMAVLNNSSTRYSVQYDMAYVKATEAVPTMNVFGTTLDGRDDYSETLVETKSFTVRPGALTEFLLIEKSQRGGSQISEVTAIDVFSCSSP
jgi:peptidoglycan hydrolase-like protein with peptidoglycan-binding domain